MLHTHKPRSIISCLLCACDHFQCLGLGGGLGVCACVTVGWWCWYGRASADLKMIAFSVALFPHYSLPLSFQSGPALLQLAAQIFIFVYILHGHTNSKVLSVWCFTSSFKPLCLLKCNFSTWLWIKIGSWARVAQHLCFQVLPFFFPFSPPLVVTNRFISGDTLCVYIGAQWAFPPVHLLVGL